jgi:hypothetical protein
MFVGRMAMRPDRRGCAAPPEGIGRGGWVAFPQEGLVVPPPQRPLQG